MYKGDNKFEYIISPIEKHNITFPNDFTDSPDKTVFLYVGDNIDIALNIYKYKKAGKRKQKASRRKHRKNRRKTYKKGNNLFVVFKQIIYTLEHLKLSISIVDNTIFIISYITKKYMICIHIFKPF
jgi:hypothetical protein